VYPVTEPVSWLSILNTFGIIGLLVLIVWAFFNGKVMPKSIHDQLMEEAESRTIKLAAEIQDGIKTAVQEGITQAIVYLRNGGK